MLCIRVSVRGKGGGIGAHDDYRNLRSSITDVQATENGTHDERRPLWYDDIRYDIHYDDIHTASSAKKHVLYHNTADVSAFNTSLHKFKF